MGFVWKLKGIYEYYCKFNPRYRLEVVRWCEKNAVGKWQILAPWLYFKDTETRKAFTDWYYPFEAENDKKRTDYNALRESALAKLTVEERAALGV